MDINKLKKSALWKTKTLKDGEILFDEGDTDNNLYVIESGSVSINKYIDNNRDKTKELAILGVGEIFGEGALTNLKPKEVSIKAIGKTSLLYIDGKKGFESYIKENSKLGIELMGEIIKKTNSRLLESNFLVTSSYSLMKYISEIKEFNNKNLFKIIDELTSIFDAKYIIYVESHPVLDDVYVERYDSREKGKMLDIVIEKYPLLLKVLSLEEESDLIKMPLISGNKVLGYIYLKVNNKLTSAEEKAVGTIAVTIAGFIRQKNNFDKGN